MTPYPQQNVYSFQTMLDIFPPSCPSKWANHIYSQWLHTQFKNRILRELWLERNDRICLFPSISHTDLLGLFTARISGSESEQDQRTSTKYQRKNNKHPKISLLLFCIRFSLGVNTPLQSNYIITRNRPSNLRSGGMRGTGVVLGLCRPCRLYCIAGGGLLFVELDKSICKLNLCLA